MWQHSDTFYSVLLSTIQSLHAKKTSVLPEQQIPNSAREEAAAWATPWRCAPFMASATPAPPRVTRSLAAWRDAGPVHGALASRAGISAGT
eukprot:5345037-Pleurochrysis_carterae.AAC.1